MELCDRRGFVASLAAIGVAGAARSARGGEALPLKISPIREGGVDEVLKVAHFEIASKPTADEDAAFRKMAAEYLEKDPAAFKAVRLGLEKK